MFTPEQSLLYVMSAVECKTLMNFGNTAYIFCTTLTINSDFSPVFWINILEFLMLTINVYCKVENLTVGKLKEVNYFYNYSIPRAYGRCFFFF